MSSSKRSLHQLRLFAHGGELASTKRFFLLTAQYCLLLAASYSMLNTHYSLLRRARFDRTLLGRCTPSLRRQPRRVHRRRYLLLTTDHLLRISAGNVDEYPLGGTYYLLLITYYLLPTATYY